MLKRGFNLVVPYVLTGIAISVFVLLIILTNQLGEFKKYMPISELDFVENEFYNINSAKIYTGGKNVAPDEKLQLHMHVINKQKESLRFQPEVKVSIGGELKNHLQSLAHQEVGSEFFKDLEVFDFYLSDEGPNEIEVNVKAFFVNGTLAKEESVSTTIDVISLNNQLQLEQNKYTSYGIIITAIIGVATVIALIASLYFSRKEIDNLESQNNILKEESVRPYLQPNIIQKGPTNIALSLKNVGTGAAIRVNFEYELEGKSETKRSWKKPLMDKEELSNFFINTGAGNRDFQLSYEYFKQNQTKIITKVTYENIHSKKYTSEETIDVTEYVSQFEKTLEESKND